MKKVFFLVALVAVVLAGCASYAMWYRQDGIVPFEHFQKVKNTGERLVFLSPVLASNHRQCGLYIITNPEDVVKALDTVGDSGSIRPNDLNKALGAFSPVMIMSQDGPAVITNGNLLLNSDGIAGFSLPSFVNQFFYAYIVIRNDYKWGSNNPTEVWTGIMSLPPGSQDVFISFSEGNGDISVSANINPTAVKNAYDNTTGFYGLLSGKKDQIGFIKIGLKERTVMAGEQARARALAAGATYSVYSGYYTFRQETRTDRHYVPEQSHWEPGQTTEFYNNRGVNIGEARTQGRQVTDVAAHMENVNYTVDVPVLNELEFELYKGNVLVLRGRTPTKITGIEVGTVYTLRWVSPVDGNRSFQFKMGLNFLGYPGDGVCYIK